MVDIDAAGGAASAGILAGALERPTGHVGDAEGNCTDCGQPVEGKFCSNCGQPTHVHRSLLHLGEEMLHGVLHFDARIWRTLPLLAFNPGRLTREWVQGRRTRYVSPLAMFLFTVFLMFFVFSFSGGLDPNMTTTLTPAERTELTQSLQSARAELAEARRAADAAPESDALKLTERARATSVEVLETRLGVADPTASRTDGLTPGSWQAQIHDAVASGDLKVNMGNGALNETIKKKLLNPDLAIYKIQQTAYKFSFLLIPISIPFVALLFLWRRGFTLYDHGVFVLYSLTAMSILMMVVSLLGPLWVGFAFLGAMAFTFGIPVHMYAQLKGAYDLSWVSAAWRTLVLLLFCVFAFSLFLLAIITLGLTG
ncbi:MAG: DUF3667 domain-containing protein [Brevundimonas sp.]|uniref:DUF3667 domain-containing protein n=1 Tax=Brevundimonas sp. TaxID=1871086 RepID=UPI00261C209C|nr:DUF3667 domain-containing protein [Brevundimonas sp.]MDI6625045.1 DUF3667 domain-containing protein [Brevundimonas sp.]MDQ7813980.1 DUF3667 domain-containing protein [Brevundimonas sp.]